MTWKASQAALAADRPEGRWRLSTHILPAQGICLLFAT